MGKDNSFGNGGGGGAGDKDDKKVPFQFDNNLDRNPFNDPIYANNNNNNNNNNNHRQNNNNNNNNNNNDNHNNFSNYNIQLKNKSESQHNKSEDNNNSNHSSENYNDPREDTHLNYGSYQQKSKITHTRGKHTFTELEKIKMSNFESLDFPVIDNQLYRDFNKKTSRWNHMLKTFGKWAICFSIGVSVGGIAYLVKTMVENIQEFKFTSSDKYIHNNSKVVGFLVYYAINVLLAVSASLVIIPVGLIASGSGIPEVKGYLNGIRIPHSMNVKTMIGKLISLILAYSSGLILGPEGPMIMIGAMIGGAIGQVKSKTLKWYPKLFWRYHNDRDRRDFISTGAAAGVAAAFGAPIGGVLFGFEEASSFWSRQLTWRTFFACLIATFTTNMILQGFQVQLHDYGVLTFGFSQEYLYRYSELIAFAGIGVLGGLLGAFFVYCNARLSKWRSTFFSNKPIYLRVIEVFFYITLTSSLLYMAAANTSCKNIADIEPPFNSASLETNDNSTYIRFFCPEGQYNDMAGLSFNTLDASLRLLYSRSGNLFTIKTLIIFTVISFLLTTVTSGLMMSSGLFIPMMLVGASLGRLVGQIGGIIFNRAYPPIDPSIYAMVGSSAMMAGFSRMTISLAIIMVELTEGTQYMMPVILSVMTAKWVGDIFNESIYEHLMEQKCYPFLPSQPPKSMLKFGITDVMKSEVVTLYEVEKVSRIIQVLQSNQHHGFPVIEKSQQYNDYVEDGIYCGLILRSQLIILLNYHIFCHEQPQIQNYGKKGASRRWGKATDYGHIPADSRMNYQVMTQSLARHFPPIGDMQISKSDIENMYIDLRPYMNLSSVVANETFSYTEGYQLFRTMGLRHMPVVNKRNEVVGIITRKDLL